MSEYGITISARDIFNFLGFFLIIYVYLKVTKFDTFKGNVWWFILMFIGIFFIKIVTLTL